MCSFLCGIVLLALDLIVSLDRKKRVSGKLKRSQKQELKACRPFIITKLKLTVDLNPFLVSTARLIIYIREQ